MDQDGYLVDVLEVGGADLTFFVGVVSDVIDIGTWCFEDPGEVERDLEWFTFPLVDRATVRSINFAFSSGSIAIKFTQPISFSSTQI